MFATAGSFLACTDIYGVPAPVHGWFLGGDRGKPLTVSRDYKGLIHGATSHAKDVQVVSHPGSTFSVALGVDRCSAEALQAESHLGDDGSATALAALGLLVLVVTSSGCSQTSPTSGATDTGGVTVTTETGEDVLTSCMGWARRRPPIQLNE